jgi:hypothetical protein
MNYEFLKSKSDKFFQQVTGDELVKKFEALGYTFEEIPNHITWNTEGINEPIKIDRVDLSTPTQSLLQKIFHLKKNQDYQKNLTPDFSGSFFLFNIAV